MNKLRFLCVGGIYVDVVLLGEHQRGTKEEEKEEESVGLLHGDAQDATQEERRTQNAENMRLCVPKEAVNTQNSLASVTKKFFSRDN
jgi:hypothetical protein